MIPDISNKGLTIKAITHLSPPDVIQLCEQGALLIDLREVFDTAAKKFGVKEVCYIPNSEFRQHYRNLPTDRLLIMADGFGLRSKEAVEFLMTQGFKHIANLNGGMVEWAQQNYPLQINKDEIMNGSCACMLKNKTTRVNYK